MDDKPVISWNENGEQKSARWRSASGNPAPRKVVVADDRISADAAFRLVCEGSALLWKGDFHNARQLLQALARRVDRKPRKAAASAAEAFHINRQAQARRAHILGMLLLPFEDDYRIPLRRAPDVHEACSEAYGPAGEASVMSLRELQGLIGAHEWRRKGVEIPALGARIHPHYGVYSPIRGEYMQLVAEAALPSDELAFDIGTGTGVLAAILAKRGMQRIIATDIDARALACAADNLQRLGFGDRVELMQTDLFPPGRASLVVCNPPWIPARPASRLDHAVYDPDSRMLRGYLGGLASHLAPGGEGWLILSDLAELLGLRSRDALLTMIEEAGLKVLGRNDVRPAHPRASDPDDPLHAARAAEVTSLWRLAVP